MLPLRGNWGSYYPYTNVLWVNYIATKIRIKAKLKGIRTKFWKAALQPYVRLIKRNRSVKEVFLKVFSPEAMKRINATFARSSTGHHDSAHKPYQ